MARTQVWAHRGASGWDVQYAPENTMPAFEKAIEMGADGIELDVQLTRDGEIVICHDERIDRTSDGSGWLKDYTLAELKHFNFSKPHPEYGFVPIPTLKEFFSFMVKNDFYLNIEFKTSMIYYDGIEEKTVLLAGKMGVLERIIFSSFNHYSLQKLKVFMPHAVLGLLCSDCFIDIPQYPRILHADAIHPIFSSLTEKYVHVCHSMGFRVHTYTVNHWADMQRAVAWGVDSFITNCPDHARREVDGKEGRKKSDSAG